MERAVRQHLKASQYGRGRDGNGDADHAAGAVNSVDENPRHRITGLEACYRAGREGIRGPISREEEQCLSAFQAAELDERVIGRRVLRTITTGSL